MTEFTDRKIAFEMIWEILEDMRGGTVPQTITTFGDLHDYVDANMYANEMVSARTAAGENWADFIVPIQDIVEDWLQKRLAFGTSDQRYMLTDSDGYSVRGNDMGDYVRLSVADADGDCQEVDLTVSMAEDMVAGLTAWIESKRAH